MPKEMEDNSKEILVYFIFKLHLEDLGFPRTFANFTGFHMKTEPSPQSISFIHMVNFSVVYNKMFHQLSLYFITKHKQT